MKTEGSYPTMITPYKKDGTVDFDTAERFVDWYWESGCRGVFAVCQSSEIFYLSPDEMVELNRRTYERAKKISGGAMVVVSSGHVAPDLKTQARELNRLYDSGTDALIFITNRLDPNHEGDDVFLENLKALMNDLPKEAHLGLYECPHPYKRLLTERILRFCADSGRFTFIKDTCCDASLIAQRLEILKGSSLKLLNANCQTLLDSLRHGAAGYCGIMANFHPRLYAWLCDHKDDPRADQIQAYLGITGFTEVGLPYPLTAKYHMNLVGIPTEVTARNRRDDEMTAYAEDCMRQMKKSSDFWEAWLSVEKKD